MFSLGPACWLGADAVVCRLMRTRPRLHRLADERLECVEIGEHGRPGPTPAARSILRRCRVVPWLVGLLSASALYLRLRLAADLCGGRGLVVSLLGRPTRSLFERPEGDADRSAIGRCDRPDDRRAAEREPA